MKLSVLTTAVAAIGLAMATSSANAGMKKDGHGNVGYDTYDECVAAVKNGTAKFYTPYTHQSPKRWRDEVSVQKMKLSDVTVPSTVASSMSLTTRDYNAGACDLGVGKSNGRSGVSGALVGKYVPYSPDMPVNVYMNKRGVPVRLTMQQCDNHFGSKFPVPVISEMKALPAQLAVQEDRNIETIELSEQRTVRPATPENGLRVKQIIVAPQDQVHKIATREGTKVVVQNARDQGIVVGEQVDPAILEEVRPVGAVPVIQVPEVKITTPDGRAPVIEVTPIEVTP